MSTRTDAAMIDARNQRIAMLEAKLAAYDKLWAEAAVAMNEAGIPDWEVAPGAEPKDGVNRHLTLAERIARLRDIASKSSERVAEVQAILREARTQLGRTEFALRRIVDAELPRTIIHLDATLAGPDERNIPKCKSLDCWLCHGLPANAGPR